MFFKKHNNYYVGTYIGTMAKWLNVMPYAILGVILGHTENNMGKKIKICLSLFIKIKLFSI